MPKHFIVTLSDVPSLTISNEQLVKAIREVLGCYFIPTVEVSDITAEVEGKAETIK